MLPMRLLANSSLPRITERSSVAARPSPDAFLDVNAIPLASRLARLGEVREQSVDSEGSRRLEADGGPEARPAQVGGLLTEPSSDRVERHVGRDREQMLATLDQGGVQARLEDVSDTSMPAVEALCIHTVQLTHSTREIRLRRLDENVVVVAHLTVRKHVPTEPCDRLGERLVPQSAVCLVPIDELTCITAYGDVVDRAWEIEPQRSRHASQARSS